MNQQTHVLNLTSSYIDVVVSSQANLIITAWTVTEHGDFSGRYFPLIRLNTNTGK